MDKVSRRKLAQYIADCAHDGMVPSAVIDQLAAYLVETRRVREGELVVRAIEAELEARGIVVADVTAARQLDKQQLAHIQQLVGAETMYVRETVDPDVLGGIRVKAPSVTMDATLRNKIDALNRAKV